MKNAKLAGLILLLACSKNIFSMNTFLVDDAPATYGGAALEKGRRNRWGLEIADSPATELAKLGGTDISERYPEKSSLDDLAAVVAQIEADIAAIEAAQLNPGVRMMLRQRAKLLRERQLALSAQAEADEAEALAREVAAAEDAYQKYVEGLNEEALATLRAQEVTLAQALGKRYKDKRSAAERDYGVALRSGDFVQTHARKVHLDSMDEQ